MPASIVLVQTDHDFLKQTEDALARAGYDVASFCDSLVALTALEDSKTAQLLITGVDLGSGRPHGISLFQVARLKRPHLHVLFTTGPEHAEFAGEVGELLPYPTSTEDVVEAVHRLLGSELSPTA